MSASVGTFDPKVEAHVNDDKTANVATHANEEEEVKTSSPANTSAPRREKAHKEVDSGMIAIGYCFEVPSVKWHPQLEMMSKAGLTQGQYERKVWAQKYVVCLLLLLLNTMNPNCTWFMTSCRACHEYTTILYTFPLFCSLTRSALSSVFIQVQTSRAQFSSRPCSRQPFCGGRLWVGNGGPQPCLQKLKRCLNPSSTLTSAPV